MADFYEIDFLDVETKRSGDAITLRYSLNGVQYIHVVDAGYQSTGERVVDHIKTYYGDYSYIDHVIATHNDQDHAGGLGVVLEEFSVGALWMLRPWMYAEELIHRFPTYSSVDRLRSRLRSAYANLAALEDIAIRKKIPIYEPFQGASIGAFNVMAPTRDRYLSLIADSDKTPQSASMRTDSFTNLIYEQILKAAAIVRAAWGEEVFPPSDTSEENEMSVVQYANICGHKILLTGDTGRNGLKEVIDYAPMVGLFLPGIDRFQVPHHGGRHNVDSELLDAIVGPRLATRPGVPHFTATISSAKEDEDHPKKVVVRALYHRGAKVLTTEGASVSIRCNIPGRAGWVAATPAEYPEEYEE